MYIYYVLSIHLSMRLPYLSATVNDTDTNMGEQIRFMSLLSLLLDTYAEGELLDHMVILDLIL